MRASRARPVPPPPALGRLALAALLAAAPAAAGERFQDVLGRRTITRPIGEALADTVGRALPVTAASPGVTYTFDVETGAFERATEILGQLFLERPHPLGRRRWSLRLDYQWFRLDAVDGRDLDRLRDPGPPILDPDTGLLLVVPRFALALESHLVTAGATWGVTDDLDVDLTLPVITSRFAVDVAARALGAPRAQRTRARASATGVGDVLVRGKHRLARGRLGELAAGLALRAPAGDEANFQGTGTWEVTPALYAAAPPLRVARNVRLLAYANAGVDVNADDADRSEARLGLGVDLALGGRATVGIAFLAREPFAGIAPPGAFDVVRVTRAGRRTAAPVLGLERDRASVHDLSLGARLGLWRDRVFGRVNVLLPLGDDGIRADVVPTAGLEATF